MKMLLSSLGLTALLLGFTAVAQAETPGVAAQSAQLYFLEPMDGATVSRPFSIRYGLKTVTTTSATPASVKIPADQIHLLIDAPPLSGAMPLLSSDQVRLLNGEQERFTLPRGQHRLQLLMTDGRGVPRNPPVMSPVITVTVE